MSIRLWQVESALLFVAVVGGLPALTATADGPAPAAQILGKVVRVADGDTLTLETGEGRVTVRLAQIDAPESAQPYGRESTLALESIALGRAARVEVVDVDRYGRTVGEVFVGEAHVNEELVRQGHAWAYTRYVRSLAIIDLENEARQARRGLWTLPSAERDPPWEWRSQRRRQRKRARRSEPESTHGADSDAPVSEGACGTKRTCGEMSSCAEARFYLTTCGVTQLDRDRDGVPCEALCR